MSTQPRTPFPEDEKLVVGNYYNVTCAIVKCNHGQVKHIPVIGSEHRDPQFGSKIAHLHIDGRFATTFYTDDKGQTNTPVWTEGFYGEGFAGTTVVRMKCKRLTTGLRVVDPGNPYKDWYTTMIGKSCAGRKCPHRGTHMLERNGRLLCPLHNLQGDIETETIVERIELECPEFAGDIKKLNEFTLARSAKANKHHD